MADRFSDVFYQFLDAWLTRRSVTDTLALIAEDCTGFGTGEDEVAVLAHADCGSSLSDRDLYERDILEAPNRIHYEIQALSIRELSASTGIVMATMDLNTTILEQRVSFHGLRMSFVFSDEPGGLKLRHDHISFPTSLHRMGESYPIKELEERMQVFERMLRERTRTLEEAYAELASIVNTDQLTGISSRYKLDEVLEAELLRLRRYGSAFSILFFDIDKFKSFNDEYGHAKGDEVLRSIAEAAKHCIRETDSVGRWGGDEFLILLPQTVGAAAQELAERVMTAVRTLKMPTGIPITISLGLKIANAEDTPQTLLAGADAAMYRAKSLGGNQWASR